jgi:hypothetical protein
LLCGASHRFSKLLFAEPAASGVWHQQPSASPVSLEHLAHICVSLPAHLHVAPSCRPAPNTLIQTHCAKPMATSSGPYAAVPEGRKDPRDNCHLSTKWARAWGLVERWAGKGGGLRGCWGKEELGLLEFLPPEPMSKRSWAINRTGAYTGLWP